MLRPSPKQGPGFQGGADRQKKGSLKSCSMLVLRTISEYQPSLLIPTPVSGSRGTVRRRIARVVGFGACLRSDRL